MEEWEQLLEEYPDPADVKSFIKMLKTAEVVLKKDLALFESDWIFSTLFFKPVNLFETISSKLNDTAWTKPTGDAFKLISDVVDKYTIDHLYENIVTLCLLPYPAQTRKDALSCLTRVARLSPEGARDAVRFVAELEDVATCRAPLAILVGVICEHHPEVLADSAPRIWRIYLNLLDSNKNTDAVINAVLQGLLGLFKHFGVELPVIEFRILYEKITAEYLFKGKCEAACLSMLEQHAPLFKELLAKDTRLRQHLWTLRASPALRAVYSTIATAVTRDQLQKLAESELLPHTTSRYAQLKYTSLRILRQLTEHAVVVSVKDDSNALGLEYELRRGKVTLDVGEAILWCIESNAPYSDKLLQTAVLFYNNIPATKRRDIVYGLLNAPDDVRTATVTLLINESAQSEGSNMEQFFPLWSDIFDSKGGTDSVVLDKSRLVFGDVVDCLFVVLEAAVAGDMEELPPSLTGLLTVACHILSIHPVEDYTALACGRLFSLVVRCGRGGALLRLGGEAARHSGGSIRDLTELIRIDKCGDEALLCESCRLLIQAPTGDADEDHVLTAIEILLTRKDVEPSLLSQTLKRLEIMINNNRDMDTNRLERLIRLVGKLRSSKDMTDKEARILYRDVILFLGKYGNNNSTLDPSESTVSILRDQLVLNIPNPDQGTSYKMNLHSILQLAIIHEDADVLQKLLSIIAANLSSNKDANLQLSLTLLIRALCRSHAHSPAVDNSCTVQAVVQCDSVACLEALVTYISEEKSPGVRKMLSDALEGLLLKNPGSEATEQLVKVTAERAAVMMTSDDPIIRSGGLYITETLLSALKDNHLLQRKELPNILTLILETEDIDSKATFKTAYKMFLENFEIYPEDTTNEIIDKLIKNILKNYQDLSQDIERRIYRNKVSVTLEFFEEIKDFDKEKLVKSCKMIDSNFDLKVFVMAASGWVVNDNVLEEVLVKMKSIKCDVDVFFVQAVLKFLDVYSEVLLDKKRELTLQAICHIISNISPEFILSLNKEVTTCITVYNKSENRNYLVLGYQNWCEKYNIRNVVGSTQNNVIETEKSEFFKALYIYLGLLNIPTYECEHMAKLSDVALDIYAENGEKYIGSYKNYLSDMLNIAFTCKPLDEIGEFIKKSIEKVGIAFLKCFIEEFSQYLMKKPYILTSDELKTACVILNDLLKSFLKKKSTEDDCVSLLELIETLWPTYEQQVTSDEKYSLLTHLTRLPIQLHGNSAVMKSAAELALQSGSCEAVNYLRVLPGGEDCSSTYRSFASRLPSRLSELSGAEHSAVQALLDACTTHADCAVLDIVMKLADCDPTKGWWDEAMASSMAVIARRGDCALKRVRVTPGGVEVVTREVSLMSIATTLFEYPSVRVSKRLLIPLLRYSSSSFCEQFYSVIINDLLSSLQLWVHGSDRDNLRLRTVLNNHARALAIITLAFEKIPLSSLKSPDSLLYSRVDQKQPSQLMKKASTLCVTLRRKACPDDASDELRECYRQMHVENYKCLCAAVCISRPAAKFYDLLFDPAVWGKIFVKKDFELPIKTQWTQQKSIHSVAAVGSTKAGSSTRTRVFLRTLSENPLLFDLMDVEEEPTENCQEIELTDNEINNQDCCDTVTGLLRHVSALTHHQWDSSARSLATHQHQHVAWTLHTMICNCKEELKPHASVFAPAMLEGLAQKPKEVNGKKMLNGLHVEVLETILFWGDQSINSTHMSQAIEYLINTCIEASIGVLNMLTNLLTRLLDVYGSEITVPWRCFEEYINVPSKFKTILRILFIITKHKIHIPELLPTLVSLDEKLWSDGKLSELFGYALSCGSEIERPLARFKSLLDRKRQNDVGEYVKMLYYAQIGYPKVCDEFNFKKIIDLTPKLPGPSKSKCLSIISSYISHSDGGDQLAELDVRSLLLEAPLEAVKVFAGRGLQGRTARETTAIIVPYCEHSDVKLRTEAIKVMLKSFEDLFGPKQSEPSAKRTKLNSSRLLFTLDSHASQVVECVSMGVTDGDSNIASMARERVGKCLNGDDFSIRLAESFLIAICIPATLTNKNRSLSVCVSAFLDLLFSALRQQERFKEAKLRDEPLDFSDPSTLSSKLLTNARTYQGTFLSSMGRKPRKQGTVNAGGINVQILIDEILGSLITFAKDKPDASQTLSIEVTRCVLPACRGFDPSASLSRQVCDVLAAKPGDLTPMAVELGRLLVENISDVIDFEPSLAKLRKLTATTEGEGLVQLLYEETMLRGDADVFYLGTSFESDSEMDIDPSPFSLQDLLSSFGKLSNWDSLTEQQINRIKAGLPQLWVEESEFKAFIDDYQVTNTRSWFDKLLSSYRDECKQDSLRWLRETDRWPRRQFHLSVVAEAEGRSVGDEGRGGRGIAARDCAVEWAGRIMLKRAFAGFTDSESSGVVSSSRAEELAWCRAVNERGLPELALNCIEVNGSFAELPEALSWRVEKATALRAIGIRKCNADMLKDALSELETQNFQLENCNTTDIITMNKLILSLHQDLHSLSEDKIKHIIETTNNYMKHQSYSKKNKQVLCDMFETAMNHYDEVWTDDVSTQNNLINSMADVLGHVIDLDRPVQAEMLLAVVFNRLDDVSAILEEEAARNLLEKISLLIRTIDDTSIEQISTHAGLFPSRLVRSHDCIALALCMGSAEADCRLQLRLVCDPRHALQRRCHVLKNCVQEQISTHAGLFPSRLVRSHDCIALALCMGSAEADCRLQLRLVCDPRHAFQRRCHVLKNCVQDPEAWSKTFDLMRESIFENPHATGTEYSVLKKYKNDLYIIEDFDSTDAKEKTQALNKIILELHKKSPPRASLRLSQLCPALAKYTYSGCERDECMSRILRLGKTRVVKFYEQVSVFTDAETRPVIFTVLVSSGVTRQYIHKSGERLRLDASSQRAAAAAATVSHGQMRGYTVTPLCEDSGLIEYVENTKRLRALINSVYDLEQVDIGARAEDEELILASSSLEHYQEYCRQVPAYALRSAIEAHCSSTEDFINKKQMFLETLSAITIFSWLFGLGDRHLENILYSERDGSLCCVDWSAMFQYGARELPPARLTRNVLAVCDMQALEARLQKLVRLLRASHKILLNVIKVSFKWMGDEFFTKYPYIQHYLQGRATSRDVSTSSLRASHRRYKERLVKLLGDSFGDLEEKSQYTVVDQVTCLLRQCTDPKILSVTRSGWEPWV